MNRSKLEHTPSSLHFRPRTSRPPGPPPSRTFNAAAVEPAEDRHRHCTTCSTVENCKRFKTATPNAHAFHQKQNINRRRCNLVSFTLRAPLKCGKRDNDSVCVSALFGKSVPKRYSAYISGSAISGRQEATDYTDNLSWSRAKLELKSRKTRILNSRLSTRDRFAINSISALVP